MSDEREYNQGEQPKPGESRYDTGDFMMSESASELSQPVARPLKPSEEDTAELEAVDMEKLAAEMAAEALESAAQPAVDTPPDHHEAPTQDFTQQTVPTQNPLAKETLAGSGGLDPNPDFPAQPFNDGMTVPHIVPFQHTMVHIPSEQQPPAQPPPPQYTQPTRTPPPPPPPQATMPNRVRPPLAQQQPTMPNRAMPQAAPAPGQYRPGTPPAAPGQPAGVKLPPARRKKRILGCTPGCFMIFAGVFVTFCGGLTLIVLVLAATLGAQLEERLQEQVAQVDDYRNFESTFWYDRGGALLYESFGEGRRTNVNYDDFPQELINATLAIEDDTFFTNPGIEVEATLRAFAQYVGLAEGSSGGSTITQQIVRNILFDFEYRAERSVQRKVEEIMLALLLTQRKTKQEILELYLNEIYYGNLAYGAQAAAQVLFGKDVGELTLGEAALLAGLPQAPANLDPLNPDPAVQEAVLSRWRLVLDRMVAEGFITDQQRRDALAQGLAFAEPDVPLRAPHFTVYAQQELQALMVELGYSPEDIARGGLQVYTTVDLAVNDQAQRITAEQVAALAGNNVTNAAVVVLKPLTGEIVAMVGSVDYNNEAIDGNVNVAISPRQPGSTMKAFTYSAAMERGMTPADVIWDTQTNIAGYQPRNYDGVFHGPVRMRTALANSYNIPAVQTLRHEVGVDYLLGFMQRFGVQSLGTDASLYGLSLTLGGGEITLLELTRGYSVFANQGVLVPSTAILCVLDGEDNILYQYENGCPQGTPTPQTVNRAGFGRQVLDPRIAYIITDMLGDNPARTPAMGANSPLNTGDLLSSVKTGTTNDVKDNWTIGYTANVAVGVWVGNSNGDPMVNSSGLTGAAPIWNRVITAIHNDSTLLSNFTVEGQLRPDRLNPPSGLEVRRMCRISQLREPALDCAASEEEIFLVGAAGIPDENGALIFPDQSQQQAQQPPATGPWLQEVERDIFRVLVMPIPPEIAGQIQFSVNPGEAAPPAPLYCQVPIEVTDAARSGGAREQLFLAPPPEPSDAARAEAYARGAGLAFLPTIACDQNLLTIGGQFAGGGSPVITAFISSPAPGEVLSGAFPVLGTAQFSPEQAVYYKVEISGGQFGDGWYTIGETHSSAVVNGQLEFVGGVQPGNYELQLIVVGLDGNYVQPPYRVAFTVQ